MAYYGFHLEVKCTRKEPLNNFISARGLTIFKNMAFF
jgi:hypothetical protein